MVEPFSLLLLELDNTAVKLEKLNIRKLRKTVINFRSFIYDVASSFIVETSFYYFETVYSGTVACIILYIYCCLRNLKRYPEKSLIIYIIWYINIINLIYLIRAIYTLYFIYNIYINCRNWYIYNILRRNIGFYIKFTYDPSAAAAACCCCCCWDRPSDRQISTVVYTSTSVRNYLSTE